MHGLVSLLPEPCYAQVETLWQELEAEFGLQGIKATPYPHFSWQIAQEFDFEALEPLLSGLTQASRPFRVQTAGIGIFSGPQPVLFIPVVKNSAMIALHQKLWERTQSFSRGRSDLYAPQAWMPHISLAYEDVDAENITAVINKLAFQPFNWQMEVNNLAFIYEPAGSVGQLKAKFDFQVDSLQKNPKSEAP